jgi:sugar phosphate isomerase/epimerase
MPPIAIALAGLPPDADPRAIFERASALGFRALALDATRRGLRPRDLDRSARRDLAAALRRAQLQLAGVDLFIPPEHFSDPARADRALDAALRAIEFTGEIAPLTDRPAGFRPPLAIEAPRVASAAGALRALEQAAERHGVVLADAAWPPLESTTPTGVRAIALDPAAVLLAGADPSAELIRHASRLAQARLSDLSPAGRVAPAVTPGGRLATSDYLLSIVGSGHAGPALLDLRNVPQPLEAAERFASKFLQPRPR